MSVDGEDDGAVQGLGEPAEGACWRLPRAAQRAAHLGHQGEQIFILHCPGNCCGREASCESISLCTGRRTSEAITSYTSKYAQGQSSRLACQVLHTQSKDPGRNLPQGFPLDSAVCRCIPSGLTTENLCCRSRKLLRNVHVYLQRPICLECEAEGQPAQGADGRPEAQEPLPGSMAETLGPPWRC